MTMPRLATQGIQYAVVALIVGVVSCSDESGARSEVMPDSPVPDAMYSLAAPETFPADYRTIAESVAVYVDGYLRVRHEEYFASVTQFQEDSILFHLRHHSELERAGAGVSLPNLPRKPVVLLITVNRLGEVLGVVDSVR